ncbi:MAG: hypothetical protein AB1714_11280 [Acidobacteriota bacterium]
MSRPPAMREYVAAAIAAHSASVVDSCPSAETLAEFYLGRLDETRSGRVRSHLVQCRRCLDAARDAREFVELMVGDGRAVKREPIPLSRAVRWAFRPAIFAAAAAVIVASATILWVWPARPPAGTPEQQAQVPHVTTTPVEAANPWRDMAVAKAPYAPSTSPEDELIWRDGGPTTDKSARELDKAMEPYLTDDYAAAARNLTRFLELNPRDSRAGYYLGVSLLLEGKVSSAIPVLERALSLSAPQSDFDTRWYLALALLKGNQQARAVAHLSRLASQPGPRQKQAESLLLDVRRRHSQK